LHFGINFSTRKFFNNFSIVQNSRGNCLPFFFLERRRHSTVHPLIFQAAQQSSPWCSISYWRSLPTGRQHERARSVVNEQHTC